MITRFNEFIEGHEYVIQHTYRPIKEIPVEMEPAMLSYLKACRVSGNKAITILGKETCLKRFLMRCHSNGCRSLTDLTAKVVLDACISVANKDDWAIIKNFLIHICREGYVENDYSPLVPRYQRPKPLPTIYTPEEIMAVEGAVDRSTKKGVRDYAMLLLATRLGMRIGDVVSLTFSNLDFNGKRIRFVQQKTEEPIELPLLPELEEAISDYINNARVNSSEERIFLRVSAPHIPVTTSAFRFALNGYFRTAGVNIEGRKHGPHVFRSSLASSMVNDGYSYESVRAVLGHTDPKAITHYAKLDIEKLRMCAIPVPPPSGKFKSFLEGGM
jgi:site-specific recombinase XerD